MNKKYLFATSLLAASLITVNANAFEFGKPISVQVPVTQHSSRLGATEGTTKEVTLMNIKLSAKEQQKLFNRLSAQTTRLADPRLPRSFDLTMNGVPVLDQGRHGTCVTFAETEAVDAILGKGDYVSQLCNLELGTHLEKNSFMVDGWDGSLGPIVLEQMMWFGIVNKENQRTKSCATVTEYPLWDQKNKGHEMPLFDYRQLSENLNTQLYWKHLYSNDQLFDGDANPEEMEKVLLQIKQALVKGNRVTFGTFIVLTPSCMAGACALYQTNSDTWALTPELNKPPYETGGHEMVIFGYDDDAVAYDRNGNKYKGLLKLRNSWGASVGDKGNYYMTYDYFIKFATEAQEIIALNK